MNDDAEFEDLFEESSLEEVLGLPAPEPEYRAALLRQTAGAIRRRRAQRAMLQTAALIAAFLGGVLSTTLLPKDDNEVTELAQSKLEESNPIPSPDLPVSRVSASSIAATAPESQIALLSDPEALTLRYNQSNPEERSRLLRQAGDHYLYAESDIETAASLYRRYVSEMRENTAVLFVDPSNWLLSGIANAQREES